MKTTMQKKLISLVTVSLLLVSVFMGGVAQGAAKPPVAVTNLKAASASATSIKLTWTKVTGAAGYGIYRSTSSTGTYTGVGVTTSTTFTNSNLTAGKYYYYKVRAYVMSGTTRVYGAFSSVAYTKPLPAAPASPKAVSASSTSILVSWSAVSGANGYAIFRAATATGTYAAISATTGTSYTNTGLKAGTTYFYKVRAYRLVSNVRVYGAYTAVVSAKPIAAAANYKDVVFIPSFASFQLGTECYSLNLGTRELANKINGPASMHYKYIWQENYPINPDRALTAQEKKDFEADMKVAPRYFRANLTKDQKVGSAANANWRAAILRGDAPGFIWAKMPLPTDTTALPNTTKKVYIRSWIDDYKYTNAYAKTDYKNQAAVYVSKLVKDFDRIHAARPNATIYVGSMELVSKSFPRITTPSLVTDSMMATWASLIGQLAGGKAWNSDTAVRTEINRQIAAYCKTKGYVFVDMTKSGLTDSDGYLLEKYVHINGVGFQMNQAGLTLEGDYICKSMGLPTAKEAYNLK